MTIKNVEELRNFLSDELQRVSGGEITPAVANASANLSGKILSSVKMELEYNKMTASTPDISFLNRNNKTPKPTRTLEHNTTTGEIK